MRIIIALLLVGCGTLKQADEHRTEGYDCRAALFCEREAKGDVIDQPACVADVAIAEDDAQAACNELGATECAGARWWRCEVTCENTAPICIP